MANFDGFERTNLQEVASDSTRPRTWAKLKCEFIIVKTRGAILVLVWNFFITTIYHFLGANSGRVLDKTVKTPNLRHGTYTELGISAMAVFYPLGGWLADVYFGRYKTLRCSVWIIWIGIVLTTILAIISEFDEITAHITRKAIVPCYIIIVIGLCGYQANIIQFGVDQLIDSSSQEIRAFVVWYVWTFVCSGSCYMLAMQCIPQNYKLFKTLYAAVSVTCAIVVDLLFNNHFTKEPVTINPIKLVLKVLKYALKTKQPQRRSAFTYWEDKPPSRIDFGKNKYGGPFTNEQVEDVKTFLRMCLTVSVSCIFTGALVMTSSVHHRMVYHLEDTAPKSFLHCLEKSMVESLYYNSWAIIIPTYELIINPLFHKYLRTRFTILTRILLGMILLLTTATIQMTTDVIGHIITTFTPNSTTPCMLQKEDESLNISYIWLVIPELTLGLAFYTYLVAAAEFVCAQSPYSMKGMMFGFFYFAYGVSTLVAAFISYPFTLKEIHWTWLGCGLWYELLIMVIIAIAIVLFVRLIHWYKQRDRDDELPNEQTFAVNYYERYAGRTH